MPDMLLELLDKKRETRDVMTFRFEKPQNFSYQAGQYVILQLQEMKPFTLASSPTESFLQITTMIRGSEFKKELSGKEEGDKLKVKGPFGKFVLQDAPAVMLAGGIGITPFRSMIKSATDSKMQEKITLLYSNKTPEDIAFNKELNSWQAANKNLRVVHTITRPEASKQEWRGRVGRIDKKMIEEFSVRGEIFYICGPPSFVDAMLGILKNINVPQERIKTESFTGY